MKPIDVYLKQARRNVKRDSYPLPDGFAPPCLPKEEALRVARWLVHEGYPPPLVFETLQALDIEAGHRIEVLAFARQSMMGRLDEGAIVNPNCEDVSVEITDEVLVVATDPTKWH